MGRRSRYDKMVVMTFKIRKELIDVLSELSLILHKSRSEIIREAIAEYLIEHSKALEKIHEEFGKAVGRCLYSRNKTLCIDKAVSKHLS